MMQSNSVSLLFSTLRYIKIDNLYLFDYAFENNFCFYAWMKTSLTPKQTQH